MALERQYPKINFSQGLDQKSDPKQVPMGKFLALENSVFTKEGLLQKRDGFGFKPALPSNNYSYLTTMNNNLTAIGPQISALSSGNNSWVTKGSIAPIELSTLPLIRNSVNQTQCDSAISSNGLICTVYTETNNSTNSYKYAVADSVTGQNIVSPISIPVTSGTVTGSARVFVVQNYFVIVFTNVISAVSHLQFVSIPTNNPSQVSANHDVVSAYIPTSTVAWDGVVFDNQLYIAWNSTTGGQNVSITYLTVSNIVSVQGPRTPVVFSGKKATMMSLCVDSSIPTSPIIYFSFYDSSSSTGYTGAIDNNLNTILSPTEIINTDDVLNITCAAQNQICTVFYEVSNVYGYDTNIPSNVVKKITVTQSGTVGSAIFSARSIGLASKAFVISGTIYYLGTYQSPYQPTYFLMNGSTSTQAAPMVVAKVAYTNGGGYLTLGLPSVSISDSTASIAYLVKDLIAAQNTSSSAPVADQAVGVYQQTGINLVNFDLGTTNIDTAEIAGNVHVSGGFLWAYDGYLPVEQNFFLYPDSIEVAGSGTSGSMSAQQYYYAVTYEWADNNGLVYRSAGSLTPTVTLTSDTSVAINIPYLRLTYKIANPVKIVVYRWSAGQQSFFQVTSLTNVQLNSTTSDYFTYTDTLSDSAIAGNTLLYTTGGVIEDENPPATNIITVFDSRVWLVNAEDPNQWYYSKQIYEDTPVEMSSLLTYYVAPNIGTVSSTGPVRAGAPMDDKLIHFKANAIYYTNGTGPDDTGANSQYSNPIFVTSTVGCINQASIVLKPNGNMFPSGLMFESDGKGIWLLGTDLSTKYIGSPVEDYTTGTTVESAINVPGTNQVRFHLSSGVTLMYDYYFEQWGTFSGVPAISACSYQNLHTFINQYGAVYQESPGTYVDGYNPVLLKFTTGWISFAGLQGYERLYKFSLLAQYISPHFMYVSIAYDYGPPTQQAKITPRNTTGVYGSDPTYGVTTPYGGPSSLQQWEIETQMQTCQAFQISVQEQFNPFFSTVAGPGFTMSGINMEIGVQSGQRPINPYNQTG